MKKVSIKDVAKLAGVSIATVSYVLNRKKGKKISDEVVKRINEAVEELNYTPNRIAKSLKTNNSKILGFIVADVANPFYSQLSRIVEDMAIKNGYTVIIGSSDEKKEKFDNLIQLFLEQQVDGLILAPVPGSEESIKKLSEINFPYVLIDRYFPSGSSVSVRTNNFEISKLTIELMINKGYKKILLVNYNSSLFHLNERKNGYIFAMKKYHLEDYISFLEVDINTFDEEIQIGFQHRLEGENKIDGIFFTSNKLAVSGLKFLLKNGISVPKEVGVFAFDQSESYDLFPVSVSHINQPLEQMAIESVNLLLNQIKEENINQSIRVIDSLIVEGESF